MKIVLRKLVSNEELAPKEVLEQHPTADTGYYIRPLLDSKVTGIFGVYDHIEIQEGNIYTVKGEKLVLRKLIQEPCEFCQDHSREDTFYTHDSCDGGYIVNYHEMYVCPCCGRELED